MLRKLFVNALALLAVLAVAGGAMAAVSQDDDAKKDRPAAQAADRAGQVERAAKAHLDAADEDADEIEDAAAPESADEAEQDGESFGEVRSAEVAAYHECRDAARDDDDADAADDDNDAHDDADAADDDDDADDADDADADAADVDADADACEKPGPAWENDAHPVFGADGDKAGGKPGADRDPRAEASAQRPERAAKGKAHGKPSR